MRRSIPREASELTTVVFLEKRDVFVLELDRLLGVVPQSFDGVFTYPDKVVEGNHCQIRSCLLALSCSLLVRRFDKEFGDVGLDGELVARGRVDFPISVQHDLEAR